MVYLACQHAIKIVVMWYDRVVSWFEALECFDLGDVQGHLYGTDFSSQS